MKLLQCPLPCHPEDESQTHSDHRLLSDSSTSSSLSSQPSLPSVPSLTPPSQPEDPPHQLTHHRILSTLKGHSSYIFYLALHGKHLYSGSSDSEIRVWNKEPFAEEAPSHSNNNVVAVSNGAVKCLAVVGDKLISGHQDNKIRVWKIDQHSSPAQKFKCLATLPTFSDRFSRCLLAKNYIEVRRHKKCTWVNHVDTVSALAVSRDGSMLYSASWDRSFKIWRTSDFKCLESVSNAHEDAINAMVLSSDGVVYTGSADTKIKVWKKQSGDKKHTLLDTLEKHKSAVNALALSNDGSVLYSGACDRSILVWERNSSSDRGGCGRSMVVVGALRGHTKAILCLAAVDDLVCSGSADKTVRIWRRGSDQKSYSCLAVLEGHRRPIKSLVAAVDSSSNGKTTSTASADSATSNGCSSYLVYSGSLDCDIKVWQLRVPTL